MLDPSAPLSRKDAALVASRVLTVYFLAWLISELLYLPHDIYSLHYFTILASQSGKSYDAFLRSEQIHLLCHHIIYAALAFLAAGWAYLRGAGFMRFLFPDPEAPSK